VRLSHVVVMFVSVGLLGACTESTTAPLDTGITFTPPDSSATTDTGATSGDAATDATLSEGDIGRVCMSDADCEVYCITEAEG